MKKHRYRCICGWCNSQVPRNKEEYEECPCLICIQRYENTHRLTVSSKILAWLGWIV